jgi:pilus assembly protein Flp/PilA
VGLERVSLGCIVPAAGPFSIKDNLIEQINQAVARPLVGFDPERPGGELVMNAFLAKFVNDDRGATAIEYALIAGGISIVILVAVQGIGSTLNGSFTSVQTALK